MNIRRFIWYIGFVVLGTALIVMGNNGTIDEFWGGLGAGFVVMGILRLARMYRFHKDEAYREKVETDATDERHSFIRTKAWAWAGYLFILIAGVSVIVLRIVGQETWSLAASYAACLLVLLYWICYFILSKKY